MPQSLIEDSLRCAEGAIASEFALSNLTFEPVKRTNIEDFFQAILKGKTNGFNRYNPFEGEPDKTLQQKQKERFYNYYKLESLKQFLSEEEKGSCKNVEDFHKIALDNWIEKASFFTNYQYNKTNVFTEQTLFYQTYTWWRTMLKHQNEYDIFFHNTLIFYDDHDRPCPQCAEALLYGKALLYKSRRKKER